MDNLYFVLAGVAIAMIGLTVKAVRDIRRDRENGGDGRGRDDTRVYYMYSVTHRTDDAPRPRHRGYRNPQSLRNERRREPREWRVREKFPA